MTEIKTRINMWIKNVNGRRKIWYLKNLTDIWARLTGSTGSGEGGGGDPSMNKHETTWVRKEYLHWRDKIVSEVSPFPIHSGSVVEPVQSWPAPTPRKKKLHKFNKQNTVLKKSINYTFLKGTVKYFWTFLSIYIKIVIIWLKLKELSQTYQYRYRV